MAARGDSDQQFDLRGYLSILKARKLTIAISALICVAGAVALSYRQTPIYEAHARLLVKGTPTYTFPNAENEAQVVESAQVAELVARDLRVDMTSGQLLGGLDAVRFSQTSDVVAITYTSLDPVFAAEAANAFTQSYIDYKIQQSEAATDSREDVIQRRIRRLEDQLLEINRAIQDARGNLELVARLKTEGGGIDSRLNVQNGKLDELHTAADPLLSGGEILIQAEVPSSPVSPNHRSNAALGALFGLALGIGLAFLRERLDDRFKGRPDVERAMEAPVLATVPRYAKSKVSSNDLIILSDPNGAASEAYRNLRTSLQFITSQRGVKTLLVSSPSEHEGKTSTTANLGMALAQTENQVILISADLRRPQLERYFGAESAAGLSTWLLGEEEDLGNLLLEEPTLPNIRLLPSGPIPANPAELLTSPRLSQLIDQLEGYCDLMIFDSPPVLPVADAVIIASRVKTAVLILDSGTTARSAAVHAKELLERVGGEVVGCVLNAFDPTNSPYYYEPYYYSKYYSTGVPASDGELTLEQESVRGGSIAARS